MTNAERCKRLTDHLNLAHPHPDGRKFRVEFEGKRAWIMCGNLIYSGDKSKSHGAVCDLLIKFVSGLVNSDTDAMAACKAVVKWAKASGDHGGNPYTKEFVILATQAIKEG